MSVNGVAIGNDLLSNMGWPFEELVAYASRGAQVRAGDVLGSGTCGNGGCLAELWGRRGRAGPAAAAAGRRRRDDRRGHRHHPQHRCRRRSICRRCAGPVRGPAPRTRPFTAITLCIRAQPHHERTTDVFEYFPGNYVWNLGVVATLNSGGLIDEVDRACRPIREAAAQGADAGTPDFLRAWTALTDQLVGQAEEAEKAGHTRTAGQLYFRATNYLCQAERMLSQVRPEPDARPTSGCWSWRRRPSTCTDPRVSRVAIPYEGTTLPAYFSQAPATDDGPAPVIDAGQRPGLDQGAHVHLRALGASWPPAASPA